MREALKLIQERFVGSPLGKQYPPLLSAEARDALDRLKKRFGARGKDKFVVIRDNFAFHHPTLDDMEAAFQLAVKSGDETDWCMYVQDARTLLLLLKLLLLRNVQYIYKTADLIARSS
jgi:hypothetical protein